MKAYLQLIFRFIRNIRRQRQRRRAEGQRLGAQEQLILAVREWKSAERTKRSHRQRHRWKRPGTTSLLDHTPAVRILRLGSLRQVNRPRANTTTTDAARETALKLRSFFSLLLTFNLFLINPHFCFIYGNKKILKYLRGVGGACRFLPSKRTNISVLFLHQCDYLCWGSLYVISRQNYSGFFSFFKSRDCGQRAFSVFFDIDRLFNNCVISR